MMSHFGRRLIDEIVKRVVRIKLELYFLFFFIGFYFGSVQLPSVDRVYFIYKNRFLIISLV